MMIRVSIPGYSITEKLYNGSRTLVYRGCREIDSLPVVIKLLKNPYPSFGELVQFRNQYTIAKNLDYPGIIQTYSLEAYQNGYSLVMEDFGGISLSNYLQSAIDNSSQHKYLPLLEFFKIAIQLTDTLHYLYQNRVIHKDIKPANILINPDSKQVKLIDFSISSLLPRETQEIQNANALEGTLAYLSPEQTGRMNRGIDYRSDFYSLGITFYQLLTGKLPFYSEDPMELVHCHLAKQPIPISEINVEIPFVLSKIVSKLMAKNAEDRYQTALGIKHDLENCLTQLQTTGKLENFVLGQRDISDRFLIPEKLYGREQEVQILLEKFDSVAKGSSQLMLVAGFSGIGKTAVVNEVHKPIVQCNGYFIKGKYDQFNRNIPLSAFVQAFRDLMGQLLSESDIQLEQWRSKISEAVGENGQVLLEVIPELEQIIGKQPAIAELSGNAAQNRFNLVFQKFIQVFTTKEHPLVMFLDDLQWADSASLYLLKLLIAQSNCGYLLIIGAYRDNEVFPGHPLMLTLDEIKKISSCVNTLTLAPLSQADVNNLIADSLSCTTSQAFPLMELVYQKTKGNPFFTTQFLKALHEDGLITLNWEVGCWQYNVAQVKACALSDDVVEFMAQQLQKLPNDTQDILKLAACIGNQFDLETLAIVSKKSSTQTALNLWKSLQEGFIIPINDIYKFYQAEASTTTVQTSIEKIDTCGYKFLHDRVQQAAYSLIPDEQKQLTHLKIGQLLFSAMSQTEKDEKIFEIVNQLNKGSDLINLESECEELAKLNLVAAQRAKSATAYIAALEYATKGIQLLKVNCWQKCYEITLALHDLAAEVACLSGNFGQMEQIIDRVLENARQLLDKIKVYEVKILAEVAQTQQPKAIKTALSALELLGVFFPEQPTNADITQSLQQTQEILKGKDVADLLELPQMKDNKALAVMRILATVTAAVYQAVPELLPLIVCKQVQLSVEYGNAAVSAQTYAWYGVILCGLGEIDMGDRIGELAIELLSRFQSKEFKASTINMVYPFVKPWKHHIQESLVSLLDGYHSGLEIGTLEYAAYCAYNYCSLSYFLGKDLSILEPEMRNYSQALAQLKQEVARNYLRVFYQSVANLLGENACCWEIQGSIYNEEIMLPLHQNANDLYAIGTLYVNKLILCYLFNEREQAIKVAADARQYLSGVSGCFMVPVFHFYDSLTHLAILTNCDRLPEEVINNQKKLKQWANHAPKNHLHKFYLVEAEQYRVLGQRYEAMDYYDRAIAGAKEQGYIQEEALANELAAKFYLEWKKEKVAAGYMQEAYYGYAHWGAKAKIADLEKRYPQLLAPILQQTFSPLFSSSETISALRSLSLTSTNSPTSSSSILDALDLETILKASQAISSEIELGKLLSSLLSIVVENAGADKCVLMLLQNERLLINGSITVGTEPALLQCLPIEESQDIPLKLIYKVKHEMRTAVLVNATADPVLANDSYIMRHKPKSILCNPILHQGKLLGILYLENNLAIGAFTSDRVELLNLLCAQAAISLENARLYQQSQTYAQQLEEALREQQKLAALVQTSNDFIGIATLEGQTIYLNLAGRQLVGIDRNADITKFYMRDFHTPEDYERIEQEMLPCVMQQGVGHGELNFRHFQTGELIPSDYVLFTITDPLTNEPLYLASINRDVRDRKLAELAIEQKTLLLQQALEDLQQAQLQMIQSEKMSALGNLVAGVAHEMNNPLAFISASLLQAKPTFNDIVEHLKLYREILSNPTDEIMDHAEEIDLDYSLEDLPKVIDAMSIACDKLKNISTSLRTFSRADRDYKVPFNIHEGIDSTILILKHRLKANEQRPAIEVITNYGNLPQINCFPGQLNQVFMNIIANAIDAIDESNIGRDFAQIKENPNQITIQTLLENEMVKIIIADNGKGMSEEVKEKIFDRSFTTKAVGKGTGLGLAIAQSIVTEKHGGSINVNSTLGKGTEFTIALPIKEK
ncbi:AAA family ATPase [Aerosakkonemataceae cyanobacterium BLCC-F50]|uniref:histidine kinase n=1 Tax=Floridaenema flaviceps BLCC-F50 TaxID=3153642 RepID=A0ABV4XUT2_9CYAN